MIGFVLLANDVFPVDSCAIHNEAIASNCDPTNLVLCIMPLIWKFPGAFGCAMWLKFFIRSTENECYTQHASINQDAW